MSRKIASTAVEAYESYRTLDHAASTAGKSSGETSKPLLAKGVNLA